MHEHADVSGVGIGPGRWLALAARLASSAMLMLAVGCTEPEERTAVATEVETASASTETTTASSAESASSGQAVVEVPDPDPGPDDADGPAASAAPTGSTATTAIDLDTMTRDDLEDLLATRYEAFWQAFGQVREAPTTSPVTDFPVLAALASGEQLEQANAEVIDLASRGQALRAPVTEAVPGLDADSAHRIRVERVDGSTADLVACFVNDRIAYQVADGAVISDAVVTVKAEATMVRTDGTWKLDSSRAIALDPGVAGCWLEDEADYPW